MPSPQILGTLEFSLPDTSSVTIRDVQLWRRDCSKTGCENTCITSRDGQEWKGYFRQYVDLEKLPLWVCSGEEFLVFSRSTTTVAYFGKKLRYETRGIVVCITDLSPSKVSKKNGSRGVSVKPDDDYSFLLLYRQNKSVFATLLQFEKKLEIDSRIQSLSLGGTVPETTTLTHTTIVHTGETGAAGKSKENNIDQIIEQSKTKRAETSNRVKSNLMVNERRLQFNETLSRLILSGLRLRGIPNTQSGFRKLYRMTFQSAEFAHRNELQALMSVKYHSSTSDDDGGDRHRQATAVVPFEELQETVETLLKLFTKV